MPYTIQGTPWVHQYVMQAPAPMTQVDESYNLAAGHISAAYKGDGQPPRSISVMVPSPEAAVPYNPMIPQVTYC